MFLITLVTSTEDLIDIESALKNSKEFGIKDLSTSYKIKGLQIVEGKVLTDKKNIKYSKIFEG